MLWRSICGSWLDCFGKIGYRKGSVVSCVYRIIALPIIFASLSCLARVQAHDRTEAAMLPRCAHCLLPIRIHFAACHSSGIRGYEMPPESQRPSAIVMDPRELRYCRPVDPDKLKAWKRLL